MTAAIVLGNGKGANVILPRKKSFQDFGIFAGLLSLCRLENWLRLRYHHYQRVLAWKSSKFGWRKHPFLLFFALLPDGFV